MTGYLFMNDTDMYTAYGLFLAKKKGKPMYNFSQLMKPAKMKPQVVINIREQNGVKTPPVLNQQSEARDVTLYFGLTATSMSDFLTKRSALKTFLQTGEDGWLNLRVPEIDYTFRMYVTDFPDWEQIAFRENKGFGYVSVTFFEPNPQF
jgi:hypothetical protein